MKTLISLVLLSFLLLNSLVAQKQDKKYHYLSATKTAAEIEALENKHERLYYSLAGHFTNKEQADTTTNPILKNVQELLAIPIFQNRVGEYWLCVRWIPSGQPDRPLAESFYQVTKLDRDTFSIQYWEVPEEFTAKKRPKEWRKKNPYAGVNVGKLKPINGCKLYVYEEKRNFFVAITKERCNAGDLNAQISEVSMDATYSPDRYTSYAEFFAKNGVKLFDYKPSGSIMMRLDKNTPIYK